MHKDRDIKMHIMSVTFCETRKKVKDDNSVVERMSDWVGVPTILNFVALADFSLLNLKGLSTYFFLKFSENRKLSFKVTILLKMFVVKIE